MCKGKILGALAIALLALESALGARADDFWFVVNEDNDHFFKCPSSEMTEAGLVKYADYVLRGKVTHFVMCVCGQRTSYDSKAWEPIWAGLGERARKDTATRPDGTHDRWAVNAKLLCDAGIDPYAVWIRRCREKGVSPWISMRMNDVHFGGDTNYFRNTTFYKSHREWWLVPESESSWFDWQFDFAHKEVRDYTMAEVREIASRWDSDGIELDWMRFGNVFQYGHERENAHLLDDFMREVRRIVDAAGKAHGRRMGVAVRVPYDPLVAEALGFNAVDWAREGLVDVVVPDGFIAPVTDLPVAKWLKALAGTSARLVPGTGSTAFPKSVTYRQRPGAYRFLAARFAERGARGVYVFNVPYMSNPLYSTDGCSDPTFDIAGALYSEGLSPTDIAGREQHPFVAPARAGKPVFLNVDDTHFYHSRASWKELGEKEVRDLVRQYRGTDVTDLLFCIGGRIADVPNGVKECWLDKYDQRRENGRDVCYTNQSVVACAKRVRRDLGIDPYVLWLEESRRAGIRGWLSFRMNDCHDNQSPTSWLHPEFFHAHPEYRRIRYRESLGYFERCFDYAIAAVRERELKFIAELLGRYDMDGVEIDWLREPYCFVPGREDTETMTAFMREVRNLADKAAKRLGHPVRVASRVPANPETALQFGFDAAAWAEEGIVDVLSPCPRWRTTDPNLPVALWKRLVRHTKVQIVPGVELLTGNTRSKPLLYQTREQLYGNVNALYSGGADGVYLYNFYDDPHYRTQAYFSTGRQPFEGMAVYYPTFMAMLRVLGSPQEVFAQNRDHMLAFEDLFPDWDEPHPPFPKSVEENAPYFFRLVTGGVPSSSKVFVRIGVHEKVNVRVTVNGRPCEFLRTEACVPAFTPDELRVYAVQGLVEKNAVVEVLSDKAFTLTHLDIQVRSE